MLIERVLLAKYVNNEHITKTMIAVDQARKNINHRSNYQHDSCLFLGLARLKEIGTR